MVTSRERLIDAAFALFEENGFDATTVDDVAARAGLSRATFFRAFASKEDVIFPDHEAMLAAVRDRLRTSREPAALAATEAAHVVFDHYLAEGRRARQRYRLARSVAALRDRESASLRQYQRTFTSFLRSQDPADDDPSDLRAELLANAVVTAHNHVLRRWLRGDTTEPEARQELAAAMSHVRRMFDHRDQGAGGTDVVVIRSGRPIDEILPELRTLVRGPAPTATPPGPRT